MSQLAHLEVDVVINATGVREIGGTGRAFREASIA
jgi:hypothetical protein